jgi:hypothetical protein
VNAGGSEVVQHSHLASAESADPYVCTFALGSPMVVPANPTGKFRVTASFDVSASPEVPGSTGIFMWDEVTEDGEFRPAVDMNDGGDSNWDVKATMGLAQWTPLSPTITFSYTQD